MNLFPTLFGSRSRSTRRRYGRSRGTSAGMPGGQMGRAALMGLAAYGFRKFRERQARGQSGAGQTGIPSGTPGAYNR